MTDTITQAVYDISQATNAKAVTVSATITPTPIALWVGGAGNINVTLISASAAVTFDGVPAGTVLPVRALVVNSASTTATGIIALYTQNQS